MSKKNKSVLSIMLALVILLAPLSALHAKAENEKPYIDITTTYILTGEIKLTDGTILEFPEERHEVREQYYPDGTWINEEEYNAQMEELGGSADSHLLSWAEENGFSLGSTYVTRTNTDSDIVTHYYNSNDEEVTSGESYYVNRGTQEMTCHLYYDASEPIYNYELKYNWYYYIGSDDLSVSFDARENELKSVRAYYYSDGTEIPFSESDYTYNGSNLVCINRTFLDSLGVGEYRFEFYFETPNYGLSTNAYITIVEASYSFNQTELEYKKGIDGNKKVYAEAPDNSLTAVLADGVDTNGMWSASFGGRELEITLNGSLFESLDVGTHVLTFVFKDGTSRTVTANVVDSFWADAEYDQPYNDHTRNYILTGEILLPDGTSLVFPEERHTVHEQRTRDWELLNEEEWNTQMQQLGGNPYQHLTDWASQYGYNLDFNVYVTYKLESFNSVAFYFNNNGEEISYDTIDWESNDYYAVDRQTYVESYHLFYDASQPIYNYHLSFDERHLVGSGDLLVSFDAPENSLTGISKLDQNTYEWVEVPVSESTYQYNGTDQVSFSGSFLDSLGVGEYQFMFNFLKGGENWPVCANITVADYSYEVTPSNLTYSKGIDTSLTFKVEAPDNSLTKIEADGFDTTGMWSTTYSDGKLEVTVNSAFLDGLNAGENTVTLVFANGTTRTITVNARTGYYSDVENRYTIKGEIVKDDGTVIPFEDYTFVVKDQYYPDGTRINEEEYYEQLNQLGMLGERFYQWAAEQGYPERDEVEEHQEDTVWMTNNYFYNSNNEEITESECNWAAGDYSVTRGYIEYITYYQYKAHSYELIEGEGSVFVQNSGRRLKFVYDATPASLRRVVIDDTTETTLGALWEETNVAVELTPNDGYLNNLSVGDHTITVYFSNGISTTANFKVVAPGEGGEETLPHEATEHVIKVTGKITKLDGTVLVFNEGNYSYLELWDADGYLVDLAGTQEKESQYSELESQLWKWAAENGFEGKGDVSYNTTTETFNLYFNSKGEAIASENYNPNNGDYSIIATREIRTVNYLYKESIIDVPHDEYTYQVIPVYEHYLDSCMRGSDHLFLDIDAPADSLTSISIDGIEMVEGMWESWPATDGIYGIKTVLLLKLLMQLPDGETDAHFTFSDGHESDCVIKITDPYTYKAQESDGQVYIIHSNKNLQFHYDVYPTQGYFVYIDGVFLGGNKWGGAGSPVLSATWLDQLEEGEHVVVLKFEVAQKESVPLKIKVLYSYEILEGKENEYNAAEGGEVSVHIDGPLNMVQNVLVDGKVVDPSNYDLTEGSTIVTFHEDYLKTLANDKHYVQVEYKRYDDKEVYTAKATITVTQSTAEPTDDNSSDNNSSDTNSSDTNSSDTNSSDSSSSGESSGTGSDSSDNKDESSKTESGSSANESSKTDSSSATDSSNKDNSSKEDSQSGDSDKPKTGDAGVVAAACLLMVSMIGIAGAVVLKKKFAAEK